jgi:hypothetical protein
MTYEDVEVQLHAFLTSALSTYEGSISCPLCFTLREIATSTHWIGGWEAPGISLDAAQERKSLAPLKNRNPTSSAIQTVTNHYADRTILTPVLLHKVLYLPTKLIFEKGEEVSKYAM